MKPNHISIAILLMSPFLVSSVGAQEPASGNQNAAPAPTPGTGEVPRLIKFNGTLLDEQEQALKGPVGVTFALYAQQSGGAALWMETQNVKTDANGNYTVPLGANTAGGVPAELFVSGEARWLGIQVGQQPEHDRILLVSVPYALKAGDAETLGGLPASAFVTTGLANTANSANSAAAISTSSAAGRTQTTVGASKKTSATPQAATPCSSVTSDGTAATNSIGLFTTPCNIQTSLMSQATVNGFPGINLAGNNAGLLMSGTGTHEVTVTGSSSSGRLGQDAQGFFFASDTPGAVIKFDTNNSGTLTEWMRITSAGNVGIGTTTPASKLEVDGNTTAFSSAIIGVSQAGSNPAAFTFSPTTIPPVAVGGIATATSGGVAGVGGLSFSSNGAGVEGLNFSSGAGTGVGGAASGTGGTGVQALATGTSGGSRGIHAATLDSTGTAALLDNEASGNIVVGRVGPSGARVNVFRVDGSGDVLMLGNFHSATPGDGIILKSPNGTICKLLGIDNTGVETFTTVTCPPVP